MRIAYIDRGAWWGGAEESLAWLAGGMCRRGHDVRIVVDSPAFHHDRYAADRLRVVPRMAELPIWAAERWRRPPPGLDRLGVIRRARWLATHLRQSPADVVHINLLRDRSRWDLRAAREAGCAIIGHLRQLRCQAMPSATTMGLCDRIIAVSDAVATQARETGYRGPLDMIYDGVDPMRFSFAGDREAARGALGLAHEGPLIGFPAALEPRKGQDIAIEAFSCLKDDYPRAILALAGGATVLRAGAGYVAHLQRLAAAPDVAGRVRLLGPVADMGAFYAAADVILALSWDGEAFGRVPAEAALAGRPVIGIRAGATPEIIVDGETGLLVTPGDARDAEAALRRLLDHPDEAKQMGARARSRARRMFDSEARLDDFAALYARASRSG